MNSEGLSPQVAALLDSAKEYLKASDTDKAITCYEKALEGLETVLDEYAPLAGTVYSELSYLYEDKGDIPNTLKYVEKYSQYIQHSEGESSEEASLSFIHLAELYKMNGDIASSELNYKKALRNYTISMSPKNENLPQVYFDLGIIYAEQGDKVKAKEYFELAYANSVEINGKDDEITQFIGEQLNQFKTETK